MAPADPPLLVCDKYYFFEGLKKVENSILESVFVYSAMYLLFALVINPFSLPYLLSYPRSLKIKIGIWTFKPPTQPLNL